MYLLHENSYTIKKTKYKNCVIVLSMITNIKVFKMYIALLHICYGYVPTEYNKMAVSMINYKSIIFRDKYVTLELAFQLSYVDIIIYIMTFK